MGALRARCWSPAAPLVTARVAKSAKRSRKHGLRNARHAPFQALARKEFRFLGALCGMGWPTIYFDLFGMRGRGRGGPQRWDWRRCADRALPFFGYGFLTSFRQRIIADHINSLPKAGYGFVTSFWLRNRNQFSASNKESLHTVACWPPQLNPAVNRQPCFRGEGLVEHC